jgi:hypothetical protein
VAAAVLITTTQQGEAASNHNRAVVIIDSPHLFLVFFTNNISQTFNAYAANKKFDSGKIGKHVPRSPASAVFLVKNKYLLRGNLLARHRSPMKLSEPIDAQWRI